MEDIHDVIFNNVPATLIEFNGDGIRAGSLVFFHLKEGLVGVPTRGPGSQLVNAACFLVPDDDARGNHSNARFYPGSGHGAVRPAEGVCEGTVLSCTRGACSRGYKRGERVRKAPKSLLEVESVEVCDQ